VSEELEENNISEENEMLTSNLPDEENSESTEEEELPPPEDENEARQPAMGNILGIIAISIAVIITITFIAMSAGGKKKDKKEAPELDKAGTKTVIEFKDKTPVDFYSNNEDEPTPSVVKEKKEIDDALDALPPEFQLPQQGEVGRAPVNSVGSGGGTYKSDRPDTKNSKSPRKIEGLAALDYSTQNSATNSISSILNGTYNTANGKMSKEEFIAQQMAQTQNLQNQLYGTGSSSTNAGYSSGSDKENFFNSGKGTAGNGNYLSNATLWDGTIISAALTTAINTDNPGVVIARVTENVYSSKDHTYLLIPEGSLLMATYNSSVSYGQNKVQVAWNLLIRPDNYRIQLGNMNGVSAQGSSGYKGSVSNHPFETLKALGMVAIYSVIQTEVANDIKSQNNEYLQNAMTDVYSEASKLGNKIVDRALDIKPTIKIKEGTEIKLITNVPLELPPVEVHNATQKYVRTK